MRSRGRALILSLLIYLPAFGQQESAPAAASQEKAQPEVSSAETIPDVATGPDGKLSQEQMRQLLRVVADKDIENDKRQRDYSYIDREVENKLDGKGQTKSTEVKTYEVLEIYGEQVHRLIAKDTKPVDP